MISDPTKNQILAYIYMNIYPYLSNLYLFLFRNAVMDIELLALPMFGKGSTTEQHPQPPKYV